MEENYYLGMDLGALNDDVMVYTFFAISDNRKELIFTMYNPKPIPTES